MSTRIAATGPLAPTPAEERLRAGDLAGALAALTEQVRARPADAAARVFLFQLLAAAGEWGRAGKQLQAGVQMDPSNAVLGAVYTALLEAEATRARVISGEVLPTVVGEPDAWVAPLLQALRFDAQGLHAQAAPLRAQALDEAPAIGGRIDGAPFAWLADADPRFGPCFELVIDGAYRWVPAGRLQAIELETPTALCDTLWLPARLTWTHGASANAFVFARYPGSATAGDPAVRLGRRTDWHEDAAGTWTGLGQRMLATDAGEHALLDVRRIEFGPG